MEFSGTNQSENSSQPKEAVRFNEFFNTQDLELTHFLNQKGVHPIACFGEPMTFRYSPFDSDKIRRLISEREGKA